MGAKNTLVLGGVRSRTRVLPSRERASSERVLFAASPGVKSLLRYDGVERSVHQSKVLDKGIEVRGGHAPLEVPNITHHPVRRGELRNQNLG